MKTFNRRKVLLIAGIFLVMMVIVYQYSTKAITIETPDISRESLTGLVVNLSDNTVTIDINQKYYTFTIKGSSLLHSDDITLGDMLTVYYQVSDPSTVVEMHVIRSVPQQSEQIYEILGSAESISGDRWDKMLSHRKQLAELAAQNRDSMYVNMDPTQKVIYLTFDDGPDPINTLNVMKTLKEHEVGASFFLTGQNIRRNPTIVKELAGNGFTIGLHGHDHSSFAQLSDEEIADQLSRTNDLVEELSGKRAHIIRPPYGALTEGAIQSIKAQKYDIYLWSLDTLDWAQSDKHEILRNIRENLRPGDIILMHATYNQALTSEILPEIIAYIKGQGYKMGALPQ